jgi:hypothetical protein
MQDPFHLQAWTGHVRVGHVLAAIRFTCDLQGWTGHVNSAMRDRHPLYGRVGFVLAAIRFTCKMNYLATESQGWVGLLRPNVGFVFSIHVVAEGAAQES